MAVLKNGNVVGHVPRRVSAACSLFIQKEGRILCTVQASRRYSADLPQGGLEIPCTFRFIGAKKIITKLRRLPWLSWDQMELSIKDKEVITSEGLLTDKHVNFAQGLLQKEHKQLSGLQSTLLLDKQTSVSPSLQIVHSRGDH